VVSQPGNSPRSAVLAFFIADIRGYTNFTRTRGDEAAARLAATFAELVQGASRRMTAPSSSCVATRSWPLSRPLARRCAPPSER